MRGRSTDAIIDLQARTLFEPFYPSNDANVYMVWINNHTFWRNLPSNSPNDELFTISENHVSVQEGNFSPIQGEPSPDHQYVLVNSDVGRLDILNIETHETTTIAQTPNGEMISGVWGEDGLITITVWQTEGPLGHWRVRVNF